MLIGSVLVLVVWVLVGRVLVGSVVVVVWILVGSVLVVWMLVGRVLVVWPFVPWFLVLYVVMWDVLVVSRPLLVPKWMVPVLVGHDLPALVVRSLPAFPIALTHGRRHRMNLVFHGAQPPV